MGRSSAASTRRWRRGAKAQILAATFLSFACTREVLRELMQERALVDVVSKIADAQMAKEKFNTVLAPDALITMETVRHMVPLKPDQQEEFTKKMFSTAAAQGWAPIVGDGSDADVEAARMAESITFARRRD